MENNQIKIKCPCCGKILLVKNMAGIESKTVTCPVCHETSPFKAYRRVTDTGDGKEKTVYPEDRAGDMEKTVPVTGGNFVLGRLRVVGLDIPPFLLRPGRNVIGRAASSSSADIQIPAGENRRMSREHLVIEVKKISGKGFVHYVSLCKEKQNATFLNEERIEFGDCLVLKDRDVLRLPDATLRFEIPDEEETDLT